MQVPPMHARARFCMDDESKGLLRMSINDAAAHLGISVDTIRRRIRRNDLVAQRDNAGKWFVLVPAERPAVADSAPGNAAYEQMQAQHRQTLELMQRQHEQALAHMQHQHKLLTASLTEQIRLLTTELERSRTSMDHAESMHREERIGLHEERAKLTADRDRLQVQIDAYARLPWWRRIRRS